MGKTPKRLTKAQKSQAPKFAGWQPITKEEIQSGPNVS